MSNNQNALSTYKSLLKRNLLAGFVSEAQEYVRFFESLQFLKTFPQFASTSYESKSKQFTRALCQKFHKVYLFNDVKDGFLTLRNCIAHNNFMDEEARKICSQSFIIFHPAVQDFWFLQNDDLLLYSVEPNAKNDAAVKFTGVISKNEFGKVLNLGISMLKEFFGDEIRVNPNSFLDAPKTNFSVGEICTNNIDEYALKYFLIYAFTNVPSRKKLSILTIELCRRKEIENQIKLKLEECVLSMMSKSSKVFIAPGLKNMEKTLNFCIYSNQILQKEGFLADITAKKFSNISVVEN
jgi:hypothetical protein